MEIKIAAYPKCYEYDIGLHRTMTVFDWIQIAEKHLAVDGLEMYERFFTSLDKSYLQQVVETVEEAGFEIPMFICSPDFTHPDADKRKQAIDYQRQMIEVAAFLGGKNTVCRILSGQNYKCISRQQGIEWVVEAIEEVIPTAKKFGVVLGMENHYKDSQWENPEFALRMDVFLEIINSIGERENFGVQFDPSNAIIAGDDPLDLLNAIKERVVSMHASDRYFKDNSKTSFSMDSSGIGYADNLCHGVIGQGLNDYEAIFDTLSEVSFSGWISIEDGLNGIEEMKESLQFLRKMISKHNSKKSL
jgi:sugar phosphate isomerase/epimerase